MLADLLGGLLLVIDCTILWAFAWALAVTPYLNRFEKRHGYPSKHHRFALLFIAGPAVWLAMTWEALDEGSTNG